jgi:hypothetical protein
MEAAMPTITLRLDDATKEELEALARSRGQSLSDLIRSALDGLLMRNKDEDRLDITPRSLTAVERQQLALLHRILARVVGDDNDVDGDKAYQLERAQVLEEGFVGEYSMEFCGISPELSARDSKFVVDVLDLFRIVTFSIMKLEADGVEFGEDLARAPPALYASMDSTPTTLVRGTCSPTPAISSTRNVGRNCSTRSPPRTIAETRTRAGQTCTGGCSTSTPRSKPSGATAAFATTLISSASMSSSTSPTRRSIPITADRKGQ